MMNFIYIPTIILFIGTTSDPVFKEYTPYKKFLHIFPSPPKSFIYINTNHFGQEASLRFTVTNLFGQVLQVPVQESSSSSWMLYFSSVLEGAYVVRQHISEGGCIMKSGGEEVKNFFLRFCI